MWRRLVYWQGAFGYPRLLISNYSAQPSTAPGSLDSYLATISNAVIAQIAEGTVTNFTNPPPAANPYPSVVQVAVCTYLDSAGNAGTIKVPAPKLSIFLADGITVNPAILANIASNATVDGFISPQGNAIASMVSGVLNGPAFPGSTLT